MTYRLWVFLSSIGSCLHPVLHSLFHLPFNSLFLYSLSLVKKFFALCKGNFNLCLSILKINLGRNQSVSLFLNFSYQLIYLMPVQEEFSCPVWLRLAESICLLVGTYMGVYKKDLYAF